MSEQVQCAECADVYDSEEHPFCPRCGAIASAATPAAAVQIAGRSDPRRRRIQASGAMMISTGAMLLLLGLLALGLAGTMSDDMFQVGLPQESNPLAVTIEGADGPVVGALVQVTPVGGNTTEATTDSNGTARFPAQSNAVVDVHAAWSSGNYSQRMVVIALAGQGDMELVIDADTGKATTPYLDETAIRQTLRVLGGVLAAMGLVPIIGGVAAIRLKQRNIALTGTIVGALPWMFLVVASLNVLVLLVLGLYVAAFLFLRQGRALFTS